MNSSAYVFGNLGGGFTQYPEDYAHEIYEEFQLKAEAPSQVIIHRDKSIMYYGYIRKLDGEGQYIGLCVLLNGVMLSKMSNLFSVFEKVVSEMVSQGELIKMDDNGDIIGVADRLDEKQQEVERIVTYLREEVIHWESTATKLPPISYSISSDSSLTFSLADKDEDIVEASVKYGYICVQKHEEYDTPLLSGLRNVLKRKAGLNTGSKVDDSQKEENNVLKVMIWIAAIVALVIVAIFVPKNCVNSSSVAPAVDSVAVDNDVDTVETDTPFDNIELVLKGDISNIGFSMKLYVSNGEVNGTEHYDSQPSSKVVRISGNIDEGGSMCLYEYDTEKGEETGRFSGVLSDGVYSGTWSSSSGKKLSFTAKVMSKKEYEADINKPYTTSRPRFKKKTSEVEVEVEFDYPFSGSMLLVESIRGYIAEVLNKHFWWSEKYAKPKYNGDMADGQALANYIGQYKVKTLTQEHQEDEWSKPYDEEISINKLCETDNFITYETSMGGCHGGNAVWVEIFGRTFSKKDGHKVKILKNTKSNEFKQLLIQAVVDEVGYDEYFMKEFIQSPMPRTDPYLVNGGVKFVYQKYEIGPGALGAPLIILYKKDILPYLTDEAKKLLE